MSLLEIRIYFWRYDHVIEEHELQAHLKKNKHDLPLISVISPAYNEGVLIIDTVSSFLSQSYKNKEVIICSDGGTDETLEKLIEYFELVEVPDTFIHSPHITHKPIKRYFKSANPLYKDLTVIDKENGGKADAQNAGVAIAQGEIVTIIDADSILEKYALIHLADIFERERRVIGIGTPIGVLNDCNVGPDGVEDASVPKSFWAKIQVVEYMRSFLLGRMFAQRYRGLQIVSGAFGVYKKWIIEAVGGYSKGSLAEDMDIDAKIWRYIDTNKLKYRIRYVPEVFCWSEVPDTFKSLASQRDRWARGMTETILKNKDLFFNPKYKMLGLFSFPYYVFFEWLTPFIEIIGLLFFIVGVIVGLFPFFILEYIILIYWIVGIVLNVVALSVEAFTRGHYKNRATLLRLSFYAILEPLFYHWINSYLYVLGNVKLLLFKKRGWGEMERVGIKKSPDSTSDFVANLSDGAASDHAATTKIHVPEEGELEVVEHESEVHSRKRGIAALVVIALAMAVLFYFGYYLPAKEELRREAIEEERQLLAQEQRANEIKREQEQIHLLTLDSITQDKTIDSLVVEQTVTPQDAVDSPVEIKMDKATDATAFVGKIDTLHNQTGRYYIVVASVINPEFVANYTTKLSKKGIHVTIVPAFGKRNFYLIALEESPTLKEAQSRLEALKPVYGDEIWVLKH